jgi:phage tail-like protein
MRDMHDFDGRLLAALPAIYRATDDSGQLRALLGAFERVLLSSGDADAPAIAEEIDAIPSLFAPLGVMPSAQRTTANGPARIQGEARGGAPERFLPWLAQWVAFTPYRYFSAEELRRIVAGIVPLYGRRGTRDYMEKLLVLCFGEIGKMSIDENPKRGLVVGRARVGVDSVLAVSEPFRFRVEIRLHARLHAARADLEERVRAVVEFARPAHTQYELVLASDDDTYEA